MQATLKASGVALEAGTRGRASLREHVDVERAVAELCDVV